jgi:L-asparaginase / beta-aspartyl-peptidase
MKQLIQAIVAYPQRVCMMCILLLCAVSCKQPANESPVKYAIAIHGGAGNIQEEAYSDSARKTYTDALQTALDTGLNMLARGGKSLDVVEKVINLLEDCPLFNAGKGAVYTYDGKISLDASIMDGSNMAAGAVAGVSDIKNPISAARKVMNSSPHVLLSGKGASEFAASQGIVLVDSNYFFTERSWNMHFKGLEAEKKQKFGTVGCVVMDSEGNLAAGTSTGGMTNKRWGRIGDSPIIGAGTYANNNTCAVSCTGQGEFFIRYSVAHDISALVEYKKMGIEEAANLVINDKLKKVNGQGGVIVVDKQGNITVVFNTPGMFRAFGDSNGKNGIGLFGK